MNSTGQLGIRKLSWKRRLQGNGERKEEKKKKRQAKNNMSFLDIHMSYMEYNVRFHQMLFLFRITLVNTCKMGKVPAHNSCSFSTSLNLLESYQSGARVIT